MTTRLTLSLAAAGLLATLVPISAAARGQQAPAMNAGPIEIHDITVREVRFDRPYRVVRDDGSVELKSWGYQAVVRGTAFPVRALDPILWLDQTALTRYERCQGEDALELVYTFFDPAILRAERVVQLIYGTDERTRTRLLARLDPEKLERLPQAERRALGIPDLEFLVLEPQAGGRVRGRAHLDSGHVRLAARRGDGKLELCSAAVPFAADGSFEVPIEALPSGTTHLFALLEKEQPLPAVLDQEHLPEGVEILDAKPWR